MQFSLCVSQKSRLIREDNEIWSIYGLDGKNANSYKCFLTMLVQRLKQKLRICCTSNLFLMKVLVFQDVAYQTVWEI